MPPDFVFKNRGNGYLENPVQKVIRKFSMYQFDHMDYPEKGGQFAWFVDCPFPAKGHPYPHAVNAVNEAKRYFRSFLHIFSSSITLPAIGFLLSSKKKKVDLISRFLESFVDFSSIILDVHRLEDKRYSPCSRALRDFLSRFLSLLGVKEKIAEDFAEYFSLIIEYDDAYRLRIEDILSTTSKEKILHAPAKELVNIIKTLREREVHFNGEKREMNVQKFASLAKMLRLLLWVPSFRKAFKGALASSDFTAFQYDDADRYHVMLREDYRFMGYSVQERVEMYKAWHEVFPPFPPRIIINKG